MKKILNSAVLVIPFLSWYLISYVQEFVMPELQRFTFSLLEIILFGIALLVLLVFCLFLLITAILNTEQRGPLKSILGVGIVLSIVALFVPGILLMPSYLTLRLPTNGLFLLVYYIGGFVSLMYKDKRVITS